MRLFVSALLVAFAAVGYIAVGSQQIANPTIPGILTGVVVDDSGNAVARATVELRTGQTLLRTAVTDARGTFRFENVVEGAYEVHAVSAGFLRAVATVNVGKDRPVPAIRLALRSPKAAPSEPLVPSPPVSAPPPPPPPASPSAVTTMPDQSKTAASAARIGGALTSEMVNELQRHQRADFNTEAYDKIDEHRFRRVADDPLSTFSIDVDTASYSNVRRFLNTGTLPPVDAVRIEELINYFRFSYKNSQEDAPFSVTTEVAA